MASATKRLVSDFHFQDNALQKTLGEMRFAIHQLQGLDGSKVRVVTSEDVEDTSGGIVGEAPLDGQQYGRQSANWSLIKHEPDPTWIDYVTGYSDIPNFLETIPEGDVYQYDYLNGTLFRLVGTGGEDQFYNSFSSPTLANLVSEKPITL